MSGNGYDDVESLKQEIEELKHSCNSNYAVYIRRLERKKTKIKELESFVREITSENERLAAEAAEMEGGIMRASRMHCSLFIVSFRIQNQVSRLSRSVGTAGELSMSRAFES